MENQEPSTILFGKLEILTDEQFNTIIQTMDREIAKVFLINAVKYAYERGAYDIAETELISKCIRVLKVVDK